MDTFELAIFNRGVAYFPAIIEPIIWEDVMEGVPSKLTFTVVKGQVLNFQEGNPVRLRINDKNVFFGFVFKKQRSGEHHIKVTAYDQIRYLKNSDTIVFQNASASDILKQIKTVNPSLQLGDIDETGYKLDSYIADNKSYIEMVMEALNETTLYTNKKYLLYDEFGKLHLKDIDNLIVPELIITDENIVDFDYETSIDSDVYNKIKILVKDDQAGIRDWYIAQDTNSINNWGLLQKHETVGTNTNAQLKADSLLKLHNKKKRTLDLKGVDGDLNVRAGFRVMIALNLGDIILQNFLIVETVKHTFRENEHTMDIRVIGGGFSV